MKKRYVSRCENRHCSRCRILSISYRACREAAHRHRRIRCRRCSFPQGLLKDCRPNSPIRLCVLSSLKRNLTVNAQTCERNMRRSFCRCIARFRQPCRLCSSATPIAPRYAIRGLTSLMVQASTLRARRACRAVLKLSGRESCMMFWSWSFSCQKYNR